MRQPCSLQPAWPAVHLQGGKAPAPAKGAPAGGKGGAGAQLVVGQFTVEPAEGMVQPGTKVEVSVTFKAEGARVYKWVEGWLGGGFASMRYWAGKWPSDSPSDCHSHATTPTSHHPALPHLSPTFLTPYAPHPLQTQPLTYFTRTHTHTTHLPPSEVLGVDITERDFADCPGGIPYEVAGESCIPGIDASALEAIFEEHTISAALDPAGAVPNQLGLRERAFNFGAVIADLVSPPPPPSTPPGAPPKDPKKAAEHAAAAAAAAEAAAKRERGGVRAALKFTNPIKVPCVLNLSVKPKVPAPDPKGPAAPFPMEVVPAQLVIPPQVGVGGLRVRGSACAWLVDGRLLFGLPACHTYAYASSQPVSPHAHPTHMLQESRYTTVYFEPRAIAQYVGTLEASVENGSDAKTKFFSVDLRGEGTLPSLAIVVGGGARGEGVKC